MSIVDKQRIVIGIDLTSRAAHMKTGMVNSLHAYLLGIKSFLKRSQLVLFVTRDNYCSFRKYVSGNIRIIITTEKKLNLYCGILDAIHLPFNEVKRFINCPTIVTIYDVIPEHFPDKFPSSVLSNIRKTVHESDYIVTISDFSKHDIISRHNINADKIYSTFIPFHRSEYEISENINLKSKYNITASNLIFYPAAARPHKNHETLFKAMQQLPDNIGLILSTGESHGAERLKDLASLAEKYSLTNRIYILGRVPRIDYLNLFQISDVLVFPSAAEGYGLPVVEAFGLECPVITSESTCLPEISEGASISFNTYDSTDLANKISDLLKSDDLRAQLIEKGKDRFNELSSEKYYCGLLKAYHSAIDYFLSNNIKTQRNPSIHGLLSSTNILYQNGYFALGKLLSESIKNYSFISHRMSQASDIVQKVYQRKHMSPLQMTILLDCSRLLSGNMYSGISRYIFRILTYLSSESSLSVIPFFNASARGVPSDVRHKKTVTFTWEGVSYDLLSIQVALKFAKAFKKQIVYHSPYHPLPIQRDKDISYVLTICDIFHITHSQLYDQQFPYITSDIIRSINTTSDEILSISRFTGHDVQKHLNKDISITFSPLAPFNKAKNYDLSTTRNCLLIPFQNDPRKGFMKMVEVAKSWLNTNKNGNVIIYGKVKHINNQTTLLNSPRVRLIDSPNDKELIELYKKSFAFLYLSELEGFGIPPLEAMQYGCAPIILNNSALTEIYQGWEFMLDNKVSIEELVRAIENIRSQQLPIIDEKCKKILFNYTWEITKATHIAAYLRSLNH
ncbi:glycosyltransferase [Gynuella sp.]|uniref:glycosyltransferase n=1 Tax=Gynuella sp. TaxID=2969146 RepID=UPI003D0D3156